MLHVIPQMTDATQRPQVGIVAVSWRVVEVRHGEAVALGISDRLLTIYRVKRAANKSLDRFLWLAAWFGASLANPVSVALDVEGDRFPVGGV